MISTSGATLPPTCHAESPRFLRGEGSAFSSPATTELKEKLNYMHANLLARKLVKHPRNWPWSSWSFYESSWSFYEKRKEGLIQIDPVD
jgi:hypothetical protein